MTSPLFIFLFVFLAVCFFLILVQRDFTKWEKFSLLVNPALLALIILVSMTKISETQIAAKNTAFVANEIAAILNDGTPEEKKAAADFIRKHIAGGKPLNYPELYEKLKAIRKK